MKEVVPSPRDKEMGRSSGNASRAEAELEALRLSAARLRGLLEFSSEAIAHLELDAPIPISDPPDRQVAAILASRIVECNDAYARLHGFDRAASIAGRRRSELENPIPPAAVLAFISGGYRLTHEEGALRQPQGSAPRAGVWAFMGGVYRLPEEEVARGGREGPSRWMRTNVVGVVESGRLSALWLMMRDVTRQHVAERGLRESEERFQRLALASFEGIAITDGGVFIDANPQ